MGRFDFWRCPSWPASSCRSVCVFPGCAIGASERNLRGGIVQNGQGSYSGLQLFKSQIFKLVHCGSCVYPKLLSKGNVTTSVVSGPRADVLFRGPF